MTEKIDFREIQEAVRKKYTAVSRSARGRFQYPAGREGVVALEYDLSLVDDLPDEVLESFCGVGNPFSLGPINPGEALLDVGCGAGFDLIMASRLVGPRGRVCGIDLTPEMVHRARRNLRRAGVPNGRVLCAGSEAIPFAGSTFDVVISNGVLNLSPMKEKSFQEIYRVLRPNGRLQFADIGLKEDLPPEVANSLEAWSE